MLKTNKNGACLTAVLSGEIDHCSAGAIRAHLENCLKDKQIMKLHLDFSGVEFMDSSGVGMLIGRYNTMKKRGGCVSAGGLSEQTDHLFRLAGLHRIIAIIHNRGENENA